MSNFAKRMLIRRVALPVQQYLKVRPSSTSSILLLKRTAVATTGVIRSRSHHVVRDLEDIIRVPPMADGDVKFTIRIGDPVSSDENVMEIVTNDDVVVTVKAPESGQITEIYVSEGETVKAGQDLFKIERC